MATVRRAALTAAVLMPCATALKSHQRAQADVRHETVAAFETVPDSSHIKAVRRGPSDMERISFDGSTDNLHCGIVSDILASRNDTSLAKEMWDIACTNTYKCDKKVPNLGRGCVYAATNARLSAMFETIGRPNPCSFHDMYSNSLFVPGECPSDHDTLKKEVTSHGGVTYEKCDGGLITRADVCTRASPMGSEEQIRDGNGKRLKVFVVDAIMGLPDPWERVMMKRQKSASAVEEAKEKSIAEVAKIIVDESPPAVKIEFFSCGKEGQLTAPSTLQKLCGDQVTALQQSHAGHSTCKPQVYKPYFGNTGITFTDFNAETDLKYIDDDGLCDKCDYSYDDIWAKHMPEEKGKAKILLCKPYSVLGISAFPWGFSARGTMIDFRTMPGGGLHKYDMGKTVVHELGHYFGLYHTFQDGCYPGDGIADTDSEQSPFFGCPTQSRKPKTCDGDAIDPVHAFMDYADDRCMCSFTFQQIHLMRRMAQKYIYPAP